MATIIKIQDEPGGRKSIKPGYKKEMDIAPEIPIVGQIYRFDTLRTSIVKELVHMDGNGFTFKTTNSVYQVIF